MKTNIVVPPNKVLKETRISIQQEGMQTYAGVYVGKYTYCWGAQVDNGVEFTAKNEQVIHNFHMGNFNSLAGNINVIFGRNHNTRMLDTGALQLMLADNGINLEAKETYTQKGTIILQNDIWIGQNVTIMPGVIIRNGAVVARNSHVVKDVPPYAIVGGNPARVIGYRFNEEQIKMLQEIQWWYWDDKKLLEDAQYVTEDIDAFCEKFYSEAHKEFIEFTSNRKVEKDAYFAFVDYYEGYYTYPLIMEGFVNTFHNNPDKKLILYVQDDCDVEQIKPDVYNYLETMVLELNENCMCKIELKRGNDDRAKEVFLNCSHYITSRTFRTAYYTCLADRLDMDIIHGVDYPIPFK